MRLNVTLYRTMAYITGVILIILCALAVAQAFAPVSGTVNAVGTLHGGLYIVYLLVSFPLTRKLGLRPWPTVAVLLAGTVPVMTFVVERWISRTYIEPALAGSGEQAGRDAAGAQLASGADAVPPSAG